MIHASDLYGNKTLVQQKNTLSQHINSYLTLQKLPRHSNPVKATAVPSLAFEVRLRLWSTRQQQLNAYLPHLIMLPSGYGTFEINEISCLLSFIPRLSNQNGLLRFAINGSEWYE